MDTKPAIDKRFQSVLEQFHGSREELIPILQKVQEEFGYIMENSMLDIAKFIRVSESQVYSVATFYSQFRFTPKGKKHVAVCRGTACHVRGAPRVLEQIEKLLGIKEGETSSDLEYSLETVACIGACGLAPNMRVNDVTYGRLTRKKIHEIFGQKDKGASDEQS